MSETSGPRPEKSISGKDFFAKLRSKGFDFFTGVPCSLLAALYPPLEGQSEVPYIEAIREDEAVAQAAGAYMAGKKPVVLMQNSGLGNSLNAIISLNQIYQMPFLLLITWRGFEGRDAPEHLVMGKAMPEILKSIEMPFQVLAPDSVDKQLDAVAKDIAARRPVAIIVKEGILS